MAKTVTKTQDTPAPEQQPAFIEVAENTMLGDLMKCVLDQVKALPKSWPQLSEKAQEEFLYRIELQCRQAVTQAVRIILSQDRQSIPAQVESVTFKEGVKVALKMVAGAEGRHTMADAEGRVVNVVIMESEHLTTSDGKPRAEKDQRDLPLDEDATEEAAEA